MTRYRLRAASASGTAVNATRAKPAITPDPSTKPIPLAGWSAMTCVGVCPATATNDAAANPCVADYMKPRWRRVDPTETATGCGTSEERSPNHRKKSQVERTRRRGQQRPPDHQRQDTNHRFDNTDNNDRRRHLWQTDRGQKIRRWYWPNYLGDARHDQEQRCGYVQRNDNIHPPDRNLPRLSTQRKRQPG